LQNPQSETYWGNVNSTGIRACYDEGKRAAEHLCALQAIAEGFEAKIARCFAFVGPHLPLDSHFAIGNFIQDALLGRPMVIQGDGTPYRSYLYASDLAVALWTILFRGVSARAYNVGSREHLTIAELASAVCDAMEVPQLIRILEKPLESGMRPSRYVPDVSRVEQELCFRESVPLADAIRKTADWYRRPITSPLRPSNTALMETPPSL
jgi:dTDP-glucose 4,6-dehydratase